MELSTYSQGIHMPSRRALAVAGLSQSLTSLTKVELQPKHVILP